MMPLTSRPLIFPATEAGAAARDAYVAWSNLNAGIGTPDPDDWRPFQVTTDRRDAYGQPWCVICEYLPDWVEPDGGAALRALGVIHDRIVYPPEE